MDHKPSIFTPIPATNPILRGGGSRTTKNKEVLNTLMKSK
jgi:hypothetical protein